MPNIRIREKRASVLTGQFEQELALPYRSSALTIAE